MRLLGLTVTRNESDRILDCSLQWHGMCCDAIHVYDDGSDDETVELARKRGCIVRRRPDDVPSFLEHEGRFRQASWDAFEQDLSPDANDWILAFDADEVLVGGRDESDLLWANCEQAEREGLNSLLLPVPEVFNVVEVDDELRDPHIRVDGAWRAITGRRLFRYQPGGRFADKVMACGSAPTYATGDRMAQDLWLLHYGYALSADRISKYHRYSGLPGHSQAHVDSILGDAALTRWDGPHFNVWRGVR